MESEVDVIFSVYTSNNTLKTTEFVPVALNGDVYKEVKAVEMSTDITLDDGDYIRMFIWEGDVLKPVAKAFNKEQKYVPEKKTVENGNIPFTNTEFFAFNGRWLEESDGMVSNYVRPYVEFDVVATDATKVVVNFDKPDNTANVRLYVNGYGMATMGHEAADGYISEKAWDISDYIVNGINHIRIVSASSGSQLKFRSVDISDAAGYLTAAPKENNILFIGDSISEQEGYTLKVPMALDADYTVVAKSGIAFLDGHFGGSNKENAIGMQTKFYHYESISDATVNIGTTPYDFEKSPDYTAIVINIGTNDPFTRVDTELSTSPFAQAYDAFLKDLTSKYPEAKILVVKPIRKMEKRESDVGYSNDFRNQMYNKLGETIENGEYGRNVYFVDTWEWDITMALSDSVHPNTVGYIQMADLLIDYMEANNIIK